MKEITLTDSCYRPPDDFTGIVNYTTSGNKIWYKKGNIHREDGPAWEYSNGTKEWWINGEELTKEKFDKFIEKKAFNRAKALELKKAKQVIKEKKPTMHDAEDPIEISFFSDLPRNYTGKAVSPIKGNGKRNVYWYKDGKFHREDGPAKEYSNGEKHWLVNGVKHRENGPAVEYPDGTKLWFLNGKEYTEKEYNNRISKVSLPNPSKDDPMKEYLRSANLPENFSGLYNFNDGNKCWFKNGKLHCEIGPAKVNADGISSYFLDGIQITENKFEEIISKKSVLEIFTEYNYYRPAKTFTGVVHYVGSCQALTWYSEGKIHRENGPAVQFSGGAKEYYYLHGKEYSIEAWNLLIDKKLNKEINDKISLNSLKESYELMNEMETKEVIQEKGSYINKAIGNPKEEIKDAAWNVGTNHFIDTIRIPLAKALSKQTGFDNKLIQGKIAWLLGTDIGKTMIATIFTMAVPLIETKLPEKYLGISSKFSEKLRTKAYEGILNMVVSTMADPLKKAIEGALDKVLMTEERIRVISDNDKTVSVTELIESVKTEKLSSMSV